MGSSVCGNWACMTRLCVTAVDTNEKFDFKKCNIEFLYRNVTVSAKLTKATGCGNIIVWNDLPVVPDEILAELNLEVARLGGSQDMACVGFEIQKELLEKVPDDCSQSPSNKRRREFEDGGAGDFEFSLLQPMSQLFSDSTRLISYSRASY